MTKKETHYEKYLRNGNEIFKTYCSTGDKHPIMLPRAPQQTYIDIYPEDQPGCSFENDRNQQLNYEAEVIVYRALEKLSGGDLIVLHSFEYSHFQYYLEDLSHIIGKCLKCKKRKADREGECDFIVIAPNFFVIIEVKNMGHIGKQSDLGCNNDQQSLALVKTFQKSLEQRNKMVQFVKRFCKRLTVLQFTVYPNFQKAFKKEFLISRDQLSTIIFKEDIEGFFDWWKENVSDLVLDESLHHEFRTKHEDVRNLLLAIWCTKDHGAQKTICDKSKCSLGKCIVKINERLRSGRFAFRSNNPEVIPSPKIVKDFLGINNLTKQQYDLINSYEMFLWINGPAGAGKTVVLLAKILQLALSSKDNKIVLFCETIISPEHLLKPLKKAGVKHASTFVLESIEESTDEITYTSIFCRIRDYLNENQVVIIWLRGFDTLTKDIEDIENTMLINVIRLFQGKGIHVFIDDIQVKLQRDTDVMTKNRDRDYDLLKTLLELSSSCRVWISCDMLQNFIYIADEEEVIIRHNSRLAGFFNEELSSTQLVSLSKNLRNTSDLSKTLSIIREHILEQGNIVSPFKNYFAIIQSPGHYIHGPKSIVHVLQRFDKELIYSIFVKEFNELCFDDIKDGNDVGILHTLNHTLDTVNINLIVSILDDILFSTNITPRRVMDVYSKEWPAVIVLQPLNDHHGEILNDGPAIVSCDSENLYIAMSRARAKCTVIIFPLEGAILDDYHRMSSLLDKLEDSVEVRYH